MEQQDKIKQYLYGKLSEEAAAAFRQEMVADPQLADWVRSTKQLMLLDEMEAREKVRGYLLDKGQLKKRTLQPVVFQSRAAWAAAAAVVVLVVATLLLRRPPTPDNQSNISQAPSLPASQLPVSPAPEDSMDTYTETPDKPPETHRTTIKPIRVKQSRILLNDDDMQWLNHYNDDQPMGYAENENQELTKLWTLIKNKKFRRAIVLGNTIDTKDDRDKDKATMLVAYAYAARRQPTNALVLLEEILKQAQDKDINTKNTARLLAAKCYYYLAKADQSNSIALEKCKTLLNIMQQEKSRGRTNQVMGEAFWKELEELVKSIK